MAADVLDRQRLMLVLADEPALAGLGPDDAVLVDSNSNEVWSFGDRYLRICWRGDQGRLNKEALLAAELPDPVPYPTVLGAGQTEELSWMVTVTVPGSNLAAVWPSLSFSERRSAVGQVVEVLEAVHGWRPSPELESRLRPNPIRGDESADEVAGQEIYPVRAGRLWFLVDALERMPLVEADLPSLVRHRLGELLDASPYESGEPLRVVHGDASLANFLWEEGKVRAFLDFEWARLGSIDMEWIFLRYDPCPNAHLNIADLVREAYPAMFEHPRLADRLWLYELGFHLRQAILWPPRNHTEAARSNSSLSELRSVAEVEPAAVSQLLKLL